MISRDDVDITALKYIVRVGNVPWRAQIVAPSMSRLCRYDRIKNTSLVPVSPWRAKISLLHRHVYNSINVSVQLMGYTSCEVRISRDKRCFAGRTGERDTSIRYDRIKNTSLVPVSPWRAKISLLHRHVYNSTNVSVQFMGYTSCEVRISRDKRCFAGRTGERDTSIIME